MTPQLRPHYRTLLRALLGFAFSFTFALALYAASATKSFNIPAGDAAATLKQFGEQSGLAIMFAPEKVQGVETKAVTGNLTPQEALDRLLADTPLYATPTKQAGGYSIRRETAAESKNVSRAIAESSARPEKSDARYERGANGEKVLKLDTFEVFGRKTLNMDIPRSKDDAQPYVIFDSETITYSGTPDLQEFLRSRLTMNTVPRSGVQNIGSSSGSRSSINLRGLGSNQTLILIDGRRMPNVSTGTAIDQPDINGIPLSAIERIEVLPSTASGIYGGGATGGVVNIVLKRGYSGGHLSMQYDNSFSTDSARRRVDFNAGATVRDGSTSMLVSGSYSDSNRLQVQDRDFAKEARELFIRNASSTFYSNPTPPLGGTTNIRSADGSNLVLKTGQLLNSPITFVPNGYSGITSDSGVALIANAGRYNLNIPVNDLGGGGQSLVSAPKSMMATASLRHSFSRKVEAFVDAALYRNRSNERFIVKANSVLLPVNAPNNPFTTSIRATFPIPNIESFASSRSDSVRAVGGLILSITDDWKAEFDYTWNRSTTSRQSPVFNPGFGNVPTNVFTSGTLDVIRDTYAYPLSVGNYTWATQVFGPFDTVLKDFALRASGPTGLELPGGPLAVSAMLEHRAETLEESYQQTIGRAGTHFLFPERTQTVGSAYIEGRLPIIANSMNVPGVRNLEFQLAARYDRYKTEAANAVSVPVSQAITRGTNSVSSTDLTVAMKYTPIEGIDFRMSFGTGLLPPSLTQILPQISRIESGDFLFGIVDPRRGNQPLDTSPVYPVDLIAAGNPNLSPERSKSLSAGVVIQPEMLKGTRISIDYTRIRKTDEIVLLFYQDLLDNEASIPGRIVRGPNLPGDLPGWAGPITFIDTSYINLSETEVQAFDVRVDHEYRNDLLGKFIFTGMGTWTTRFEQQVTPKAPIYDNTGYSNGPLKFRGEIGLSWNRGAWTWRAQAHYFDDYKIFGRATENDPATVAALAGPQGSSSIESQTYYDLSATYRFKGGEAGSAVWRRALARTEITVGARNIFNTSPPIVASRAAASSTTGYSAYGDARMATYYLMLKREF